MALDKRLNRSSPPFPYLYNRYHSTYLPHRVVGRIKWHVRSAQHRAVDGGWAGDCGPGPSPPRVETDQHRSLSSFWAVLLNLQQHFPTSILKMWPESGKEYWKSESPGHVALSSSTPRPSPGPGLPSLSGLPGFREGRASWVHSYALNPTCASLGIWCGRLLPFLLLCLCLPASSFPKLLLLGPLSPGFSWPPFLTPFPPFLLASAPPCLLQPREEHPSPRPLERACES